MCLGFSTNILEGLLGSEGKEVSAGEAGEGKRREVIANGKRKILFPNWPSFIFSQTCHFSVSNVFISCAGMILDQ